MVETRNTISGNYVDTGTINRPLRLRNLRGKIYQRIPTCGVFLHKYIATNTPKGVFANSLYPYHQQIQLVLVCKMVRIAIPTVEIRNATLWNYVESGTINRSLRLRNQRGKIQQRTHREAYLPIHRTRIINKTNWV